jgi:hypothetical protein
MGHRTSRREQALGYLPALSPQRRPALARRDDTTPASLIAGATRLLAPAPGLAMRAVGPGG